MSGIKRKITHPQTTLKAIRIVRSKRFKIETREKLEAFLKEALRIFDQSFLSLALTPAEKLLLTYYSNLFQ
ncbi:MAG: hypothetical protein EBX40_06710, partial [Gammaproteobacteria bacterium]|nr:hypothetical protein [Gammaproteobacteria bacterium]